MPSANGGVGSAAVGPGSETDLCPWLRLLQRRDPRAEPGGVAVTADPTQANAAADPPLAAELRPRVFPFKGLNVLDGVFQLRDGRWAFYEAIYRQPPRRRGLDDPEVAYYCRKGVFEEIVKSADRPPPPRSGYVRCAPGMTSTRRRWPGSRPGSVAARVPKRGFFAERSP
jgi:hypothetical protein